MGKPSHAFGACLRYAAARLPGTCALCGNASPGIICGHCDAAYWNEARLRCRRCALPLAPYRMTSADTPRYLCAACRDAPPSFDATLALADYRAPLDSLALGLKFRGRCALGGEFARRLAVLAEEALAGEPLDRLAPVPLSRRRLCARGYNQAWEIARPLARLLGVRGEARLLERVADTVPQAELALDERHGNVARAFAVRGPVKGLHIGLADDVMTSGATLDALAACLKAAGARRVTNFVALRTAKD